MDLETKSITPIKLTAEQSDRLDKYISNHSTITRNDAKKLVQLGKVLVNERVVYEPKFGVNQNDQITITEVLTKAIAIEPENIPLNIVYEDEDLLVINKPNNMVAHPAKGNYSGTLVNALLFHCQQKLSDINGSERPGILHRLDKDTTGLLLVAKNNSTHTFLAKQLQNHDIKREYLAIIEGALPKRVVHANLPLARHKTNNKRMEVALRNSKKAVTHFYQLELSAHHSLIRCELETGRTHQIRAHLAYLKVPILNDPLYGKANHDFHQYLHAYKLEFTHPNGKKMTFEVAPPQEFLAKWNELKTISAS